MTILSPRIFRASFSDPPRITSDLRARCFEVSAVTRLATNSRQRKSLKESFRSLKESLSKRGRGLVYSCVEERMDLSNVQRVKEECNVGC